MSHDLATDGPAAPPRANGELVFDAPWQSRAFGIAAALADAGRIAWPDFQHALIARVEVADGATAADEDRSTGTPDGYWRCWLEALGDVTAAAGDIDEAAWADRSADFADRAPGHDHDHDHDHDHSHEHDHGHHH